MTGLMVTWEWCRNSEAWPIVIGATPSIRATPSPVVIDSRETCTYRVAGGSGTSRVVESVETT
jgi:hypothetical protein